MRFASEITPPRLAAPLTSRRTVFQQPASSQGGRERPLVPGKERRWIDHEDTGAG